MFFWIKSQKSGFTLIELLVGITIITIIIVWATSNDWKSYSQNQELEIQNNKIINSFESIRNNALFWRGINNTNDQADAWKISITNNPDSVETFYRQWAIWNSVENINFKTSFLIEDLSCSNITNLSTDSWLSQVDIIFTEEVLSLSGCTTSGQQKLEIESSFQGFNKKLEINTINSLIEYKK